METDGVVYPIAQGLKDQVTGAVQGAVHSLTGNTTSETSDKVQQKKGEAQKEFNS